MADEETNVNGNGDADAGAEVEAEAGAPEEAEAVTVKVEEAITKEEVVEEETIDATAVQVQQEEDGDQPQQIYIIQTSADGEMPMDAAEVIVADDVSVFDTVTALQQLQNSGATIVSTGEDGSPVVYEEVVLANDDETAVATAPGSMIDQFVDVAEVEVGDGRSTSPVKIDTVASSANAAAAAVIRSVRRQVAGEKLEANSPLLHAAALAAATNVQSGGEFHICRLCNQFVPLGDIADHNRTHHSTISELTCLDCGKLFKSKRSLFGHRKEKHSGITQVHHCPECGKAFGRKSNLKAHRESLHYGKKFPCPYCERIFTNRSSMNQHIKKTHVAPGIEAAVANLTPVPPSSPGTSFVVQQD